MAQVGLPEEQRGMIIWNFMEELLENYQNAVENGLDEVFHLSDLYAFGLLSDGFTDNDKIAIIKEYAKEKGYIKVKGDTVTLTNKGRREARKSKHDWDTLHSN
ncbi:MAG TPA: hypothetical protein VH415_06055 [Nitrososphaeraceae archaeon]|jgi:hypothetical protein